MNVILLGSEYNMVRSRVRDFETTGRGVNRNPKGDKPGSGPSGYCVCPSCGHKIKHSRATPCNNRNCPKCGTKMTRE